MVPDDSYAYKNLDIDLYQHLSREFGYPALLASACASSEEVPAFCRLRDGMIINFGRAYHSGPHWVRLMPYRGDTQMEVAPRPCVFDYTDPYGDYEGSEENLIPFAHGIEVRLDSILWAASDPWDVGVEAAPDGDGG